MSIIIFFKKVPAAINRDEEDAPSGSGTPSAEELNDGQHEVSKKNATRKRKQGSSFNSPTPVKRRKWTNIYFKYGFFLPPNEEMNPYPAAQCILCFARYANANLVPSKLGLHLQNQHPGYKNKPEQSGK